MGQRTLEQVLIAASAGGQTVRVHCDAWNFEGELVYFTKIEINLSLIHI